MRTPDEILAYCEHASPGPWKIGMGGLGAPNGTDIADVWVQSFCKNKAEVAAVEAILCNAREDLPQLALRVKELETKLAIAVEALEELSTTGWNLGLARGYAKDALAKIGGEA